MRQTDEDPTYSALKRHAPPAPGTHHREVARDLSDREAVVAVMVANGLTCENIAVRLSLTLRTVEDHLQQALSTLGVADENDLTYVIVAAHYNRNAPDTRGGRPAADRPKPDDKPTATGRQRGK
jgi:DNA-binding NarL/FixJ family response regulator